MTSTEYSWQQYWQQDGLAAALQLPADAQQAVMQFWQQSLQSTESKSGDRILELACGAGELTKQLLSFYRQHHIEIELTALDASESALKQLHRHSPDVFTMQADLQSLPIPDQYFDAVYSQFGIEYGGEKAFAEAARIVNAGGQISFLVHQVKSVIYQQCSSNATVIESMFADELLLKAKQWFQTAQLSTAASETVLTSHRQALLTVLKQAQQRLSMFKPDVTGGALQRLYADIAHMAARVQHYQLSELLDWLQQMDQQFRASLVRNQAMMEVALTKMTLTTYCQQHWLAQQIDYTIAPFTFDGDAIAWQITGRKKPA